jgi:tripartite-type tricarboxylate transporter receptor subunit TctC
MSVVCDETQGKITMASSGVGTPDHVYGELFNSMAGITMLHVPHPMDSLTTIGAVCTHLLVIGQRIPHQDFRPRLACSQR